MLSLTDPRIHALAAIVLLAASQCAFSGDVLQVVVKSRDQACTATVVPGGKPLEEVVPGTRLTYKDTSEIEGVEFRHSCEVDVPKERFQDVFGFCALAGGTGDCWMSAQLYGGRGMYFSAGGLSAVEACSYVCTGPDWRPTGTRSSPPAAASAPGPA